MKLTRRWLFLTGPDFDIVHNRMKAKTIERERADLSVQLIAFTDRLEDAEGTTGSQIESNRKRKAEHQKLCKLLEESQLESEDAMNVLRKKHKDLLFDFQEKRRKKNSLIIVIYDIFYG
uniref:Uncharacterized protein n=1 Tax=Panagrolaimus sp. PS1159 TaxID=55785 RepID=A0AC35EXB7_9BILA